MSVSLLDDLRKAIANFDAEAAVICSKKIVEEHVDLIEAMNVITEAMREIGEGYESGKYFLPELIGAATAVQASIPLIEEEIKKAGTNRETLGRVLVGTVAGDIHNIGKGMVAALLIARGFNVQDLGIDVSTERFVHAVGEDKPDVLAMSALLTSTAPETKKVIAALKKAGLRDKVKIIIGGGAITQGYAEAAGADGYSATAPGSVKLVEDLLGI